MKIHFISPYRTDKNIGKAINDAIIQLDAAPDDWIVHVDQDALWLRSDSKKQLEEILTVTDYDILGAMTNRLAAYTQRAAGMFNEFNIKKHVEVADLLHERNYGQVGAINDPLAAFCLCFRKSTWEQLGRFEENSIQFDYLFGCRALSFGKKLGLMWGIYIFHLYRINSADPANDIKHLL